MASPSACRDPDRIRGLHVRRATTASNPCSPTADACAGGDQSRSRSVFRSVMQCATGSIICGGLQRARPAGTRRTSRSVPVCVSSSCRADDAGFIGEHDGLDAVAEPELDEHPGHPDESAVPVCGATEIVGARRISDPDGQRARSRPLNRRWRDGAGFSRGRWFRPAGGRGPADRPVGGDIRRDPAG
jgi:hypothetical protein